MTNKEFAVKYAGHIVSLVIYPNTKDYKDAYVVGYYAYSVDGGGVIVCFPHLKTGGYKLTDFKPDRTTILHPVSNEDRLLHFGHIGSLEVVVKVPYVNPYPNKCKVCLSPARINKTTTLCSNVKCRSWRVFRNIKPTKPTDHYIRCGVCGDYAVSGTNGNNGYVWAATCNANHKTNYEPQEGDLIMASLSGRSMTDRSTYDYRRVNNDWFPFNWRYYENENG